MNFSELVYCDGQKSIICESEEVDIEQQVAATEDVPPSVKEEQRCIVSEPVEKDLGDYPQNWHYATACFVLGSMDAECHLPRPMYERLIFLMISYAIVLLQIMAANSVLFGIENRSCVMNSDCIESCYCEYGYCESCHDLGVFGQAMCRYGELEDFKEDQVVVNDLFFNSTFVIPNMVNMSAPSSYSDDDIKIMMESGWFDYYYEDYLALIKRICDKCYDSATEEYVSFNRRSLQFYNAMNIGDRMAFVLACITITFTAATEVKDIEMCEVFEARMRRRSCNFYSVAIWVLNALRRYLVLPLITACVPTLVAYMGGNAISICFNCLAIVFLLDIDNAAFARLSSGQRRRLRNFPVGEDKNVKSNFKMAKSIRGPLLCTALPVGMYYSWFVMRIRTHTPQAFEILFNLMAYYNLFEVIVNTDISMLPRLHLPFHFCRSSSGSAEFSTKVLLSHIYLYFVRIFFWFLCVVVSLVIVVVVVPVINDSGVGAHSQFPHICGILLFDVCVSYSDDGEFNFLPAHHSPSSRGYTWFN